METDDLGFILRIKISSFGTKQFYDLFSKELGLSRSSVKTFIYECYNGDIERKLTGYRANKQSNYDYLMKAYSILELNDDDPLIIGTKRIFSKK